MGNDLGSAITALGVAFMPGMLLTHRFVENPFEVVGVIGGKLTTYEFFGASRFLGMTLLQMSLLAALLSVILRLRRARGDERQQLKWFMFAAVPATALGSLDVLDVIVAYFTTDFMFRPVYILYELGLLLPNFYAQVLALLVIPVCTYIAILTLQPLRHRRCHQPHPRLRFTDRHAGRTLLRWHRCVAEDLRHAYRPAVHSRSGGIHPLDSGVVHASETPHPVLYR